MLESYEGQPGDSAYVEAVKNGFVGTTYSGINDTMSFWEYKHQCTIPIITMSGLHSPINLGDSITLTLRGGNS